MGDFSTHLKRTQERVNVSKELLKQVRSEMRAETALAMARRHAALCISVLLLALVGLGVWQWHRHALKRDAAQASAIFYAASLTLLESDSDQDVKKAIADLAALSKKAPGQIRYDAAIQMAKAQIQQGDFKAGSVTLQQLADNTSAPAIIRAYARYVRLNAASAMHALPVAEIRAGYEALARDGGPWKPYAEEGLLSTDMGSHLDEKRRQEARHLATALAGNPEVPNSIRQRAATMSTILKAGFND